MENTSQQKWPLSLLYVFAHRAEAKEFLEDFRPLPNESKFFDLHSLPTKIREQLWQHRDEEQTFVLIIGEGVYDTLATLSYVLGSAQCSFDLVINAGVAGALHSSYQIGDVVVASCALHCQSDRKWQFTSFQSTKSLPFPEKRAAVVSYSERAIDTKVKQFLATQGDVVDRELWGIAKACHLANVPWISIKVISDEFSTTESTPGELCEHVRLEWRQWSERIAAALAMWPEPSETTTSDQSGLMENILKSYHPNQLFFTHSMRSQFKQSLQGIDFETKAKVFFTKSIPKILLEHKKETPKQRAKLLLQSWQRHLHPEWWSLKDKKESLLKFFEKQLPSRLTIQYDQTLETQDLQLTINLKEGDDISQILSQLNQINFEKWQQEDLPPCN